MHGYALVSMAGEPGSEWVSLEAALSHVSTVGNFSRANSRVSHRLHSQLVEAETPVRTEWAKLTQTRTDLKLANVTEIVAHRHAIRQLPSAFTRNPNKASKGDGEWAEWNYRPYEFPGRVSLRGRRRKSRYFPRSPRRVRREIHHGKGLVFERNQAAGKRLARATVLVRIILKTSVVM